MLLPHRAVRGCWYALCCRPVSLPFDFKLTCFAAVFHLSPPDMQALQQTLSEVSYDPTKVPTWTSSVIDSCLKGLHALSRPFKYVGECMQR